MILVLIQPTAFRMKVALRRLILMNITIQFLTATETSAQLREARSEQSKIGHGKTTECKCLNGTKGRFRKKGEDMGNFSLSSSLVILRNSQIVVCRRYNDHFRYLIDC